MATITTQPNQSLLDAVLQANGTIEAAMAIAAANAMAVSDIPAAGTVLEVPATEADDTTAVEYFVKKGVVPATANLSACGMAGVTVDSYGDTTVTFSYTTGTNGVGVEYAVLPSADPAPTTGTLTTEESVEVTGLTEATEYKVWVRTNCMGNWSGWTSATFTTTATPVLLDATVILYPMQKAQVGYTAPDYYLFLQKKNAQFIATKGLRPSFLTTNKMYIIDKAFYISSGTGSASYLSSALTSMTAGGALYRKSAIPSPGEERMYWCEPLETIKTHTYRDLEDNEAEIMPVCFVNDAYDTVEILFPEITMEVLDQTATDVTVRLTRSHAAPTWADVNLSELQWRDDATTGTADPDDPLNPDKIIMVLSAGVTKVGVSAGYETDDALTSYPKSRIQMVIEVA